MKILIKTILLVITALVLHSCTSKTELGNITNRVQLDSLTSTLSPDSIETDSLMLRNLSINLNGDFLLFGFPTRNITYSIYKEELSTFRFYGDDRFRTMLNNLEQRYGRVASKENVYKWQTLNGEISLEPSTSSNIVTKGDSIGFTLSYNFYPRENNLITNIYKEVKDSTDLYSIYVNNEYGFDFDLLVNGFKLSRNSARTAINALLVKGSKQLLQIIPKKADDGSRYWRNIGIAVYKQNKNKVIETLLHESIDPNTPVKLEFAANITQSLPQGSIDLRNQTDLKDKIYARYEAIYNAFISNNTDEVINLIYPYYRNMAIANGENKIAQSKQVWSELKDLINNNKRVRLCDKEMTELQFSADGTIVQLIPKNTEQSMLEINSLNLMKTYCFYFYQDAKGNLTIR